MKLLRRFVRDEKGLELSEYAVMLAMITLLILAAISGLSSAVSGSFQDTTSVINYR